MLQEKWVGVWAGSGAGWPDEPGCSADGCHPTETKTISTTGALAGEKLPSLSCVM